MPSTTFCSYTLSIAGRNEYLNASIYQKIIYPPYYVFGNRLSPEPSFGYPEALGRHISYTSNGGVLEKGPRLVDFDSYFRVIVQYPPCNLPVVCIYGNHRRLLSATRTGACPKLLAVHGTACSMVHEVSGEYTQGGEEKPAAICD